tara:strand:+ start:215 stop:454 length:240 start_codon:yes stop_codon:yes gene_type:complete
LRQPWYAAAPTATTAAYFADESGEQLLRQWISQHLLPYAWSLLRRHLLGLRVPAKRRDQPVLGFLLFSSLLLFLASAAR